MDVFKRNLLAGLLGMAILLVAVLVYAQLSASQHFDLDEFHQGPQSPPMQSPPMLGSAHPFLRFSIGTLGWRCSKAPNVVFLR